MLIYVYDLIHIAFWIYVGAIFSGQERRLVHEAVLFPELEKAQEISRGLETFVWIPR